MATNPAVRVPEAAVESSASAAHWGAITAGAIGAVGISFILISLGGALGRAAVSPRHDFRHTLPGGPRRPKRRGLFLLEKNFG